jgi:hypothetical protein
MNETKVRRALLTNAAFSTLTGFILLCFGPAVAELIGRGAPVLYQLIGGGLLAFAGFVFWHATRHPLNTFAVMLISGADLLWVLGTGIIVPIADSTFNRGGSIAMLAVAGVVLMLAICQWRGIGAIYAVHKRLAALAEDEEFAA